MVVVAGVDQGAVARFSAAPMPLRVSLPHLENERLLECIAEQEPVDEACIDARYAHRSATPSRRDALAQRLAAGALDLDRRERGFQRTALGFEANGVDGGVDPVPAGGLQDGLGRILILVEVDGDGAVGLAREGEPIVMMVGGGFCRDGCGGTRRRRPRRRA